MTCNKWHDLNDGYLTVTMENQKKKCICTMMSRQINCMDCVWHFILNLCRQDDDTYSLGAG